MAVVSHFSRGGGTAGRGRQTSKLSRFLFSLGSVGAPPMAAAQEARGARGGRQQDRLGFGI
jgi:hypothetical protein